MKPLWTQTLAWIVAVAAAILLALATPDAVDFPIEADFGTHGTTLGR